MKTEQTTPASPSPIETTIDSLAIVTNDLGQTVDALNAKFAPVLGPESPVGRDIEPPESSCPLDNAVSMATFQLQRIHEQLQFLYDRCML